MKYLIVTADDFGISKSVDEGIALSIREGIVRSVALMPSGEAFDHAVGFARVLKLIEVGAHLALTESTPISDPSIVPSILTKNMEFYPNRNQFFTHFFLRQLKPEHIYIELKGQIERIVKAGLRVSYLTSHEHIHMMPELLNIFLRLADEYKIPAIRCTHKDRLVTRLTFKKLYKKIVLSYFYRGMEASLKGSNLYRADAYFGFLDAGRLDEKSVLAILKSLKDGVTELSCHPGFLGPEVLYKHKFHMNCEKELHALTSPRVKKFIEDNGIKLTTYGEVLKSS